MFSSAAEVEIALQKMIQPRFVFDGTGKLLFEVRCCAGSFTMFTLSIVGGDDAGTVVVESTLVLMGAHAVVARASYL